MYEIVEEGPFTTTFRDLPLHRAFRDCDGDISFKTGPDQYVTFHEFGVYVEKWTVGKDEPIEEVDVKIVVKGKSK